MKLVSTFFRDAILFYGLCLLISASVPAATILQYDGDDGVAGERINPGTTPAPGVTDLSGNGYDMWGWASGSNNNSPYFSSDTITGYGLSLDFSSGNLDGYTNNPGINAWSPGTWTIECAVKLDNLNGWYTMIGRDGATYGGSTADFYLQKNDSNDQFRINFLSVGGQRYSMDSGFTVVPGQWYRLAVTSDGTTLRMYCDQFDNNGYQLVNSMPMSPVPADNALTATDFAWTFGRGWYGGNIVDHIPGNLDDIRFSDVCLQPQELLGYNPVYLTQSDGMTVLFKNNPAYTDDYDVVLGIQPSDDVYVTVTPPVGLSVGNGGGQSRLLTFTTQDWDVPQTVTIEIADPQTVFNPVEFIQHTVQSNDSIYDGADVPDIPVHMENDACGVWGYLPNDYNFDCRVNLFDFSRVAELWLQTNAPIPLAPFAADWLLNTLSYDEAIYDRSIQESAQPFFVNTANITNPVDEKIYGQFLEHIYHSANGGLWGDMVWNRSFELSGAGGAVWTIETGDQGDELVQSSLATDVHMEFGDTAWDDYELTLQAKKDGGNEGFLFVVRAPDSDNFYWINIGGWGNTQHAIEKEVNGGRSNLVTAAGSITSNVWYDITIRCEGNNIQVWLDEADDANPDPQIFDYTDNSSPFLTGNVGVGTWATQARFRNIQVTDLAGTTTLYSGLPTVSGNDFGADYWTVFGTGNATISTDSLNDNYSVQITGDGSATGLQQDNMKFTQQAYHGSLWMKGTLAAGVKVELMDGSTVLGSSTLAAPTSSWDEYAFSITPNASTDYGSLRITLLGAGTVTIDQVSMMAQDSIDVGGYRPDLLQAVQDLHPPIIRWPGGCFASLYLWKDGIGPQEQRREYSAYMWEDQDTNSYGTDEFIRMCHQIGAEPLIVINTGITDSACGGAAQWFLEPRTRANYIQNALDWMEYCNDPNITDGWGAVRAANGHPEPYNVTYWEIDNETWHVGSGTYVDVVRDFAPALRAKAAELGVPVKLIACGSNGFDSGWNDAILAGCADLIDYISLHYYEGSNYTTAPLNYESFIAGLADDIASSSNPDLRIYNSEWNFQSTDWRTGLYAGGTLNAYERQGEYFRIGGPALFLRHTSAGGWDNAFINFDQTGWFPAPNYVVMKLWRDHYGPYAVETTGGDASLSVSSMLSEDEQTMYIHVVNPYDTDKSVAFEIDGSFVPQTAYMEYVDTGGDIYARNTLANPDNVHVEAKVIGFDGQTLRFNMPAYSAGVVTVKTSQPHTAYLYSSFRNNGEDGLHLAYSEDGVTFTALNGDASFLTPQVGSNLMRDPSICRGPDGIFHMVWTTGWNDDGIGIAHSPDLMNWSDQTYLPVMADQSYIYNCWAPEIFYDDATGKYLIFWSSTTEPVGATNNHRIWYVTTEDFVTYTDAALFYDPGFSCIDAFIDKDGDRYAMVLKDERDSGKNIRITFSDNAEGPYDVPPSASITPSGLWVEGPSIVNTGDEWMLYYDAYTSGYMGGQSSPDLANWTDRRGEISFPSGTRHGTVFKAPAAVLYPLKQL